MLRRKGYSGPITMLSADDAGPYDRPNLSKDYLAGNAPEEWIPLRSPDFYRADRDLVLKFENIFERAVEAVCPQVRASCRVEQLPVMRTRVPATARTDHAPRHHGSRCHAA